MATSKKVMTVSTDNASAEVSAVLNDALPPVPCPDPAGYVYTGMRYVPVFADPIEWSSANTYEPLEIVMNAGNSYTSKTFVPAGIDISNQTYWVKTADYNAQIVKYREEVMKYQEEVQTFDGRITTNAEGVATNKTAIEALDTKVDGFDERITQNAADIVENKKKIQDLVPAVPSEVSSTPETETFVEYSSGQNNIVYDAAYGTNMIPVTYNPIPALYIANGYRKATNIKYGNEYTATNINEAGTGWEPARNHPDTDGKFHIDCTTLAVLVANGILYGNSTYSSSGNNVANNMIMNMFSDTMLQYVGYEFAIEGTPIYLPHKRILASELAKMLHDSGRLTPVYTESKTSQFHPADILFLSNTQDELHWGAVGHCMIVCCKFGDNIIVIDSDKNRGGINDAVNYHIMTESEINQVNWKFSIPQIQWPLTVPSTNITRKFSPSTVTPVTQTFPIPGSVNIYNPSNSSITATVTLSFPDPIGDKTEIYTLAKNQSIVLIVPGDVNFSCTPSAVGLTYNIQLNFHQLATEPYVAS